MEITKAYFMLPVRDMERAVSFYRDAVGLTVEFSSPFPPGPAVVYLNRAFA